MGRREITEEGFDRHGHWSREFSLRGEGWSVIEHWAGENGFGMIHFKGRRRIYRLGDNPKMYITYIEFRMDEEENRLTVSAWIEAGILPRLFSLFSVQPVVDVSPSGFWSIRVRRFACHAINSLLARMRQPLILGSDTWHWADLHMTTLLLAAGSLATLIPFALASGTLVTIEPGLSNGLLQMVGRFCGTISILALVLVFIQQFVIVRRWGDSPIHLVTAVGSYLLVLVSTVFLFTHARHETRDLKLSHFCIERFQADSCNAILDTLSTDERKALLSRVFELEDSLAKREKIPRGPKGGQSGR